MNVGLPLPGSALFYLIAPGLLAVRYFWPRFLPRWGVLILAGFLGGVAFYLQELSSRANMTEIANNLGALDHTVPIFADGMVELQRARPSDFLLGAVLEFVYLLLWLVPYGVIQDWRRRRSHGAITTSFAARYYVLVEVVLCFALPGYFLLWGVISLPIWFTGAVSGAGYAAIHLLSTIGGCLGLWAVVRALTFYLARHPATPPNWTLIVLFSLAGIISIWTEMTGQFAGFTLDGFSAMAMIAPTAGAIHVLYLAMHKPSTDVAIGPDESPERTRGGEVSR